SPPRISGSCDTTLLTLTRIPHERIRRKIDILLRLASPGRGGSLYVLNSQRSTPQPPAIVSGLRCMRGCCLPRRSLERIGRRRGGASRGRFAVGTAKAGVAPSPPRERRVTACLRLPAVAGVCRIGQ